jgi:4-hydroxybenzoate polyprenyltransferase
MYNIGKSMFLIRINAYLRLMRFHRPTPIWLLLWLALWGVWVASAGHPSVKLLFIFICGAVVMRSAGCVINDIADRKWDGLVERTRDRPLVTGEVSLKEALILFVFLGFIALTLALQLNRFVLELAILGASLTILYPFAKRYTYFPQVILGITFGGFSILMAFAEQQGELTPLAWQLFLAGALWPIAYDTFYALADRHDDAKVGIKSTALRWGERSPVIIGIIQIVILAILTAIGYQISLNFLFYVALMGAAGLILYQQYLVRDLSSQHCLQAFRNNNWFGLTILLGFILGYC